MDTGDPDVVSTGWLRVFPGPALDVFEAVWRLANAEDGPIAGDLDELGPEAFDVARRGGFDVRYDPADDDDSFEDPIWTQRWDEWQRHAAERGRRMKTLRDVIEFMADLGVIRRVEEQGTVSWRPAQQLPLAEEVLSLSAERRETEARLRWESQFRLAENRITGWLVDQRSEEALMTVEVSLAELAARLDLDAEDVRHGLASASSAARDILVSVDPEVADVSQPFTLTVDWKRFDAERLWIRLDG